MTFMLAMKAWHRKQSTKHTAFSDFRILNRFPVRSWVWRPYEMVEHRKWEKVERFWAFFFDGGWKCWIRSLLESQKQRGIRILWFRWGHDRWNWYSDRHENQCLVINNNRNNFYGLHGPRNWKWVWGEFGQGTDSWISDLSLRKQGRKTKNLIFETLSTIRRSRSSSLPNSPQSMVVCGRFFQS